MRAVVELVGPANVALATDAVAAAGMPDGAYRLGSQDVVVTDEDLRVLEVYARGERQ